MDIPGMQPIPDADPQLAADLMAEFVEAVAEALVDQGSGVELGEPVRDADADDGGRFGWVLTAGDRSVSVLMPGVPLEQVRAWGTSAPCLQVGGGVLVVAVGGAARGRGAAVSGATPPRGR